MLRAAPARLYIITVTFPKRIPERIILPTLIIIVGFNPNLCSAIIVTRFARPSFIPGTAKVIGTRLSK